jgi:hypothetical protein
MSKDCVLISGFVQHSAFSRVFRVQRWNLRHLWVDELRGFSALTSDRSTLGLNAEL